MHPRLAQALLSRPVRHAIWALGHLRSGRTATLFVDLADPRVLTMAPAVQMLAERHELEVVVRPVPTPEALFHPRQDLYRRWSGVDVRMQADLHGLDVPPGELVPDPIAVRRARSALVARPTLTALADIAYSLYDEQPLGDGADPNHILADNKRRLLQLGHFEGLALHYAGEFYVGLERINHLEARLRGTHVVAPDLSFLPAKPARATGLGGRTIRLYFSFRSPYSYLALERVIARRELGAANVELRPVLPMVMRGLDVPRNKRLYIAFDAKREAERLDIPFGHIADPVGVGVERCIAVWCSLSGAKADQFALSAMRGIWSKGADVATDEGLRQVCADAGVSWNDATFAVANDVWRPFAEDHQDELFAAGMWGVPSFVADNGVTAWGQDRIRALLYALGN